MADNDNAQEEEQGGGFALPAATIGGAYAGALGASRVIGKGKSMPEKLATAKTAHVTAKEAYEKNLSTALAANPETKTLQGAFKAAEKTHQVAMENYGSALTSHWGEAIRETTDPIKRSKLRVANLEGQVKHLSSLPKAPDTKAAIDAVNAQITAVKDVAGKAGFEKMPIAEADKAVVKAMAEAKAAVKPTAAAEALIKDAVKSPAAFEKMAKVDSAAASKIAESTKPLKAATETAENLVKSSENQWKSALGKIEGSGAIKEAKNSLMATEKKLSTLTAIEGLNAEKGIVAFLKRPFSLLRQGSGKAKLAIAGGAVALGALSYMGVKSMRGGYADRIAEERQSSKGAEPSPA